MVKSKIPSKQKLQGRKDKFLMVDDKRCLHESSAHYDNVVMPSNNEQKKSSTMFYSDKAKKMRSDALAEVNTSMSPAAAAAQAATQFMTTTTQAQPNQSDVTSCSQRASNEKRHLGLQP